MRLALGIPLPDSDSKFHRIYHIHITRCGCSLNKAFLKQVSDDDSALEKLAQSYRISFGGRPVVGWDKWLIEKGAFWYAFSHIPYDQLVLPESTFTFCLFRDPADRVISHWRAIKDSIESGTWHPGLSKQTGWIEGDFTDFLRKIPRKHLLNRSYMFDKNFDRRLALKKLSEVSAVGFVDNYEGIIARINSEFSLN